MKTAILALTLSFTLAAAAYAVPRALTTTSIARSLLTLSDKAARAGLNDEAGALNECAKKLLNMPVRTGKMPEPAN
jgi:hypothetical protein